MQIPSDFDATPPVPDDNGTPGWNAIGRAFAALYPQQAPRHFGTATSWTLGGKDPLDGVSVYWSEHGRPHWHYVTYGFSELFGKESDDAGTSGFGFELTFRLAAPAGASQEDSPPTWPMSLLQNLARYVFETGNLLEAGHHLDANGPITLDRPTRLRHLAFIDDPELAPRDTANGRLQFLQAVGLTDDEVDAILNGSTEGVLKVIAPHLPLWLTDLDRASVLDDAAVAAAIRSGALAVEAATSTLLAETLEWHQDADTGQLTLVIGAGQVSRVVDLLRVRLSAGLAFDLISADRRWSFQAGQEDRMSVDDVHAVCVLTPQARERLQRTLLPVAGVYPVSERLQVEVRRTCLRDSQGRAIRWIG